MQPDELNSNQSGDPLSQQGSLPAPQNPESRRLTEQSAAASVIRAQIDNLFSGQTDNPYKREHTEHVEPQNDQWKQYHSAWQSYYQKYYEGYYNYHIKRAEKTIKVQAENIRQQENIPPDEAVHDLRQKLIGKVKESATKAKKSRHFAPILSGLLIVLVFLFMQFNQILIANVLAYVSPGAINPQNIVIDPNNNVVVGPESRLIIPKINVDVPVMYDIGNDYDTQMAAMTKGLAHFAIPGASSHPGQIGNTVIAGHSSNDYFDIGDYKFIFAQLDKLVIGDIFYANFKSIRYTYVITGKELVKPNQVDKLVYPTTKPILTLITCMPLGTADSRLLVTAEQVSPDPTNSIEAPTIAKAETTAIPGNSATLLEIIFGIKKN